jgi:hypothetical protein
MKVLCVLIALMVAANAQEEQKSELAECGSRFADKIQALCGNFLNKDELVDVSFLKSLILTKTNNGIVTQQIIRNVLQERNDHQRN